MTEWKTYKFCDIVQFNPTERIAKGTLAKKVAMDKLTPYCREVSGYEVEAFTGGTKFRNGDTIMARITPCLENGKTSFVSFLDDNEVGFGSTEYIVFRAIDGVTDSKFIYYFVTNPTFRNIAIKSMVGSSGRQRVQQSVLEDLEIALPPLAEQRKIAKILSAIDDKIENNRRINDNLEQHAQALFENLIGNTNLEYSLIASLNHTIETGRRPKGGVANITNGIPSIGAENIKGLGKYDYSKTKYITADFAETMKKGVIKGYELLIYKDGGKPGYFIPNFSIFGEGYPYEDMTLNEHVFLLDFGNKGYNFFAYFFMQTEEVMKYLNAQGSKAAIPGINRNDVESISIPTIDNKEVKEFCSIVEPIITSILVNSKESSRLAFLRDTLLPKLMSGELGIDDISAD